MALTAQDRKDIGETVTRKLKRAGKPAKNENDLIEGLMDHFDTWKDKATRDSFLTTDRALEITEDIERIVNSSDKQEMIDAIVAKYPSDVGKL